MNHAFAKATPNAVFTYRYDIFEFTGGILKHFLVHGGNEPAIYHPAIYSILVENIGRLPGVKHHGTNCENGDIAAIPHNFPETGLKRSKTEIHIFLRYGGAGITYDDRPFMI